MDMELQEAVISLAVAVLTLIGIIITSVVIPYIRANTTTRQRELMIKLANGAYSYAVHQQGARDIKDMARTRLENRLEEYGINTSTQDVDDLIEQAEDWWTGAVTGFLVPDPDDAAMIGRPVTTTERREMSDG